MRPVHLAFMVSMGRVFGEASVECSGSLWDIMFTVSTIGLEDYSAMVR
jgi:hypothetical protein